MAMVFSGWISAPIPGLRHRPSYCELPFFRINKWCKKIFFSVFETKPWLHQSATMLPSRESREYKQFSHARLRGRDRVGVPGLELTLATVCEGIELAVPRLQ